MLRSRFVPMVATVRDLTSSSAASEYSRADGGNYVGMDGDAESLRAKRTARRARDTGRARRRWASSRARGSRRWPAACATGVTRRGRCTRCRRCSGSACSRSPAATRTPTTATTCSPTLLRNGAFPVKHGLQQPTVLARFSLTSPGVYDGSNAPGSGSRSSGGHPGSGWGCSIRRSSGPEHERSGICPSPGSLFRPWSAHRPPT